MDKWHVWRKKNKAYSEKNTLNTSIVLVVVFLGCFAACGRQNEFIKVLGNPKVAFTLANHHRLMGWTEKIYRCIGILCNAIYEAADAWASLHLSTGPWSQAHCTWNSTKGWYLQCQSHSDLNPIKICAGIWRRRFQHAIQKRVLENWMTLLMRKELRFLRKLQSGRWFWLNFYFVVHRNTFPCVLLLPLFNR